MEPKRFTVKINSSEKIEQLLQETYNLACQQYVQLQDEMNKLSGVTKIKDLDIDGREKYAKAMANYISMQQKASAQKFDIAKLMADVMKANGDVDKAVSGMKQKSTSLDLSKLRLIAKEAVTQGGDETQTYETKS